MTINASSLEGRLLITAISLLATLPPYIGKTPTEMLDVLQEKSKTPQRTEELHKFWGYLHVSGTVAVKRYFDLEDISEAKTSPFVRIVEGPFEAVDVEEARKILNELFKEYSDESIN